MKNHKMTDPTNMRALVEACGNNSAEAARKLGLSPSVVSKSLLDDNTKVVNDLAAAAVLSAMRSEAKSGGDEASDVRRMMHRVAIYLSRTPALSMPSDVFDMLNKPLKEIAEGYLK